MESSSNTYSIKQQFDGATVFLTGATGFIGGLVMEQLLRTTSVHRIFVLLRGKKGVPAQQRLLKMLQGPMFHLVRDRPELVRKVVAVEGDLSREGLGLSAADAAAVASEAEVLIHSAADIRLEPPIQETLNANYVGTRRVLELALTLQRLRAMVHVSTAYVNINQPKGSRVQERIYPLTHAGAEVDGVAVAEELLALPKHEADRRAAFLTARWGYPNTYCLGKHLAEQLVYRTQKRAGLPIAILRPTLVTGCAALPVPGLCTNMAGPSGVGAALAIGFFPSPSALAMDPYSVWDAVPGDLVASAILATAAAVAAGEQAGIARATGCGAWEGRGPAEAPAAAACGGKFAKAAAAAGCSASSTPRGADSPRIPAFRAWAGAAAAAGDDAASYNTTTRDQRRPHGAAELAPAPEMMIVHAGTSSTYPTCIHESFNACVDFLRAHGCKASLLAGGARALKHMPATWRPRAGMVRMWTLYNCVKVTLVCFLLKLFGLSRAAKRLSVGYQQWAMNNDFKNDTDLIFEAAALRELHARVEPEERRDYLLTFGPPRAAASGVTGATADGAEEVEHPAARLGWTQYSYTCLAAIMRKLTGEVPAARAADPSRPGQFIEHAYKHVC